MRTRLVLPSFQTTAAKLALVLVVVSIVSRLLETFTGFTLGLVPNEVRKLALWQLGSWPFVATGTIEVIFGALMLVSFGNSLESVLGKRGVIAFAYTIAFVTGLLTVAVSFAVPMIAPVRFGGGTIMAVSLMLYFGLTVGHRDTNFFGLPTTGYILAAICAGFTLLNALFGHWQAVIPEATALLLSLGVWRFGGPSDWWGRFIGWRLRRQLKARSKHLEVVDPNRNAGSGSDKYLH